MTSWTYECTWACEAKELTGRRMFAENIHEEVAGVVVLLTVVA